MTHENSSTRALEATPTEGHRAFFWHAAWAAAYRKLGPSSLRTLRTYRVHRHAKAARARLFALSIEQLPEQWAGVRATLQQAARAPAADEWLRAPILRWEHITDFSQLPPGFKLRAELVIGYTGYRFFIAREVRLRTQIHPRPRMGFRTRYRAWVMLDGMLMPFGESHSSVDQAKAEAEKNALRAAEDLAAKKAAKA